MQRSEKFKSQKILIVDGSRVVRASLVRCLNKSHDVCEAHDGESAWQSVVLDTSLIAVISGLGVASEEGSYLFERVRTNRLARINQLPLYLLASDNMSSSERERAKRLGVTGFIPKKAPAAVLAELFAPPDTVGEESDIGTVSGETDIGRDSTVGIGDLRVRIERLDSLGAPASAKAMPVVGMDQEAGQWPGNGRLKCCLEQHLKADGPPTVSALIFGIDGYASLCERFGQRIADKVVDRFSRLLHGKIGAQASLLPLADGRIGIASGSIGRDQCTVFARRVCKALAAANLTVGGRQIKATVSAGIAAMPQDGSGLSAEELFYLALSRLDAAMAAGGNRMVYASDGGRNLRQGEFIARLASLLTASLPEAEMPCKSWLRSICMACQDARPEGQPAPCEIDVPDDSNGTHR